MTIAVDFGRKATNKQTKDEQNFSPDLDPNHLTLIVFLKEFFETVNFEEKKAACENKSMKNYTACKESIYVLHRICY